MEDINARKRFDERFVRSHRHVFRYIAALLPNLDDAEEVFQETCLKMLEKWRDYDSLRPIEPWACGIARNMVRKYYDRTRRGGRPLSEIVVAAVSETQHRLAAEVDLRLQKLPECLEKLSDQQRSLLRQCYGGNQTIRAVAEASELGPDALYKRLERIRRILFECIELAVTRE
ncbi:MAG: sigma-70 family RNA polymerase sigma factor [Pirellulales bacterium]|nr:sigma-70 family RNA polymerase sigma factor [Pirellulales bacterium]